MTHKGSRHRNCSDHTKSSKGTSVSESGDVLKSEEVKLANGTKTTDAKHPNLEQGTERSSGSGKATGNTKNSNRGKNTRPRSNPSSDRVDNTTSSSHSSELPSEVRSDDLISDAFVSRRDVGIPASSNKPSISGSGSPDASSVETAMQNAASINEISVKCLRLFTLFVWKMVQEWLERQKPRASNLVTAVHDSYDRASVYVVRLYPIVWKFTLQLGKLMILVSMILLNCNIRGLDSLLRMGTTSFFTVIWCSFFSLTAMIGITKMLIIMVLATILALLLGFVVALLLIVIVSTVVLFVYGSLWTTGSVVLIGAALFVLKHERLALLVATSYSIYCAKSYAGWLGLILALNLSFVSSDVLLNILKNCLDEQASNAPPEQAWQGPGRTNRFASAASSDDAHQSASTRAGNRSPGEPSTSGVEVELTSEDEISRLLNCNDHYSALGLARYEDIDVSSLKREYKKKAMLVHPDKNMGTEKAAEAFKKLQNAYEVLLDSSKRKAYDDELKRDELLNYIRGFQGASRRKNGRNSFFTPGSAHFEAENVGRQGESRRIACQKCHGFHVWTVTNRSKSQARWCQDCKDLHQSKDGDGWVEQSFQPLLFGLLQKMETPQAYVCAESRIYNATEWFICQGMNCPPNTHKPSFHVNATATSTPKRGGSGSKGARRGGGEMPSAPDMDKPPMTEEEFFEWLQNAMQSGLFEAESSAKESPNAAAKSSGGGSRSTLKKKNKGKKQW